MADATTQYKNRDIKKRADSRTEKRAKTGNAMPAAGTQLSSALSGTSPFPENSLRQ